jgi:hypothetical protein
MEGKKYTIVGTDTEVTLIHYGYDIVIVQYDNGTQELLKPNDIGLANRIRLTILNKKSRY